MTDLSTASGVSYTKYAAIIANTAGISSFIDGANEWGTKLRVMYDTYEWDGDTSSAGAVITVGALPKGAKTLGFYVANTANSAATTATLSLVDSDGNITAASATAAWTSWTGAAQFFIPALVTVSQTVLDEVHTVTVTTADQTVADGTIIVVATFYLVED